MGFKTVVVNENKNCPDCGGKSGLRYFTKINFPYVIKWGENSPGPELELEKTIHNQPMTAKCIDCGKRVNFKTGSDMEKNGL
jgi:ssDNA-binding Zn-finger/Zn-ribbon topoisomerase 1